MEEDLHLHTMVVQATRLSMDTQILGILVQVTRIRITEIQVDHLVWESGQQWLQVLLLVLWLDQLQVLATVVETTTNHPITTQRPVLLIMTILPNITVKVASDQ